MKTLVDTSAWIQHFRGETGALDELLSQNGVLTHPAVIGELSCGNFRNRDRVLGDLKLLPRIEEATFDDVIELIESRRLYGKGLSFIDVQLLASALIAGASLLSLDKRLSRVAKETGIESAT